MRRIRENTYEGMYILRPTLSDDAREKALKKVTSLVESLGGKHYKTINWGRKKMTYDIKGCREGHYYLIYFSIPANAIDEMIRENHLHEDLLRFMHLVIEAVPESDEIAFKQIVQIER